MNRAPPISPLFPYTTLFRSLSSVLDEKGSPTPVARILVRPPESRIGPLIDAERAEHMQRSPLKGRYDQAVDRESAYERRNKRGEQAAAAAEQQAAATPVKRGREPESMATAMAKSAARRSAGRSCAACSARCS